MEKPIDVLLVEDSPTDALLALEAFKKSPIETHLHTVTDGEQAMSYLRKEESFSNSTTPDFILLDWNLPRKNGFEVLSEIREDERLKKLVVIVLTTSKDEEDVIKAYTKNANAYITKPVQIPEFFEAVRSIQDFWTKRATLPPV